MSTVCKNIGVKGVRPAASCLHDAWYGFETDRHVGFYWPLLRIYSDSQDFMGLFLMYKQWIPARPLPFLFHGLANEVPTHKHQSWTGRSKQNIILGECRTLWGEPERVHAGAECAWSSTSCMWRNVHGTVRHVLKCAWSSCMCMSSECESGGEHSTT